MVLKQPAVQQLRVAFAVVKDPAYVARLQATGEPFIGDRISLLLGEDGFPVEHASLLLGLVAVKTPLWVRGQLRPAVNTFRCVSMVGDTPRLAVCGSCRSLYWFSNERWQRDEDPRCDVCKAPASTLPCEAHHAFGVCRLCENPRGLDAKSAFVG